MTIPPITPTLLQKLVCNEGAPGLVEALAPVLAVVLPDAGISTPLRLAHFLAQGAVETWMFRRLEEDLSYSAARIADVWPRLAPRADSLARNPAALANAAYELRNGNGPEASGDGWKYRGRGFFCLTGRANYEAADRVLSAPAQSLTNDPDLVAQPLMAVQTAVAFWKARNIDEAADGDDVAMVTRLVNGAALGLPERAIIKHRALQIFSA